MIRIPVASTYAWKKYRENWVQLDAPRHLFLHTKQSFELLTKNAGFRIGQIIFDSTEFQFTGSERYKSDILLTDTDFTIPTDKIKNYTKKARQLNNQENGDQACFYISKS